MQELDLGHATIDPKEPVIAGAFTTINYTYTAGHPIDDSGYIKIVFRIVSDCGTPQFDNPSAPNYCTVQTTGDCHIEPRWDPKGHTRPWSRALFLQIKRGYLDRNETIHVIYGDTSSGSPGWQMQTFCVRRFEFKTLVDPIATYRFKELPTSPVLSVIPGPPVQAVCIAPSQVIVNVPLIAHLKLEDKWGNPTEPPQKICYPGWQLSGIKTIQAVDKTTNLSATSNPIDVINHATTYHPYWADFHGQSEETVGSNPIEDYFVFARDFGLVDIVGHQGNDFQVTDAFWKKINEVSRAYYKPGAFVTFPGYEWSGNTPLGGDRNIYFTSEGGLISRSCRDLLPDQHSDFVDSPTVPELFNQLSNQEGPIPFAFAHVGGRYADMQYHDPAIELAVEIHSAWGTFEWLVEDALQRGYRIGICANSDGHKCRPGASYPGAGDFGSYGGLTCVLATSLDRESVYKALTARHFYATTGNRCLVTLTLSTGDNRTAMMGDIIGAGEGTPHLHGRVVGTGPIEKVEVLNGLELVEVLHPYTQDDLGHRLKITWSGAEVKGRNRITRWDGHLSLRGNAIVDIEPLNFWNANHPLERIDTHHLQWESATTGGVSGVILTLEKPGSGYLTIHTRQLDVSCKISEVGIQPHVWNCGGVKKEIRISRLTDHQDSNAYTFNLPLRNLHNDNNVIFIRATQEDGHRAWTSPIYVTRRVK